MKARRDKKGTWSDIRLTLRRDYIYPVSRAPMVLLGFLLIAVVAAWVAFDFFVRDARFLSNGPLSSSHAVLEEDCAACHEAFDKVTSEKCSVCHEKHGDRLGVYNWPAHYIYRSNDFARVAARGNEMDCAACHMEHRGREAAITEAADARCQGCHLFESFNDGHPQFDAVAEGADDDGGLSFPHIQHVREIMRREVLADVEQSCLYCHNAQSDGQGFEPISFDAHCDTCHLTAFERTRPLPVAAGGEIGVVTLEEIRAGRGPGTDWSLFMATSEFRRRGSQITKSPMYHADPWILENLRRLRRRLYGDTGLAELVRASSDVPVEALPALYEEAIATLETYARGLRARPEPEIRQELATIEALLEDLRRAVADPLTPFDETRFLLALEDTRTGVSEDEVRAVEFLAGELTFNCQRCHRLENATIVRTVADQRVLRRAKFDHRAHILQVRCLECHREIPIDEHLDLGTNAVVDPALDNAGIWNLPPIETCQECHTPRLASNRCLTCHFFHPNKSRRSEMLLYLNGTE